MFILACNLPKSPAERNIYVLMKMASMYVSVLGLSCLHGQRSWRLISSNLNDIHIYFCQRAARGGILYSIVCTYLLGFLKGALFPDALCLYCVLNTTKISESNYLFSSLLLAGCTDSTKLPGFQNI